MDVRLHLPGGWLTEVSELARVADEAGYDIISTPERQHDGMLPMVLAATATHRARLQTSVTVAFGRSPTVLAMEAWDIHHLSRGRFELGLGSQVKAHNLNRFGVPWSPPAPRMKEYVQTLLAVWSTFQTGVAPDFAGKHFRFTLMTPNFNPGPISSPRPRVALAAVGPAMSRVAGEVADGVLPHSFTTDRHMREIILQNIRIGLKRSGRNWSDIEVGGGGFLVLGETEADIERGLEHVRERVAFYGSTRSYHDVFRIEGLEEVGLQLHALSLEQRWAAMKTLISDEIVRTFAQTSTYDRLPAFLEGNREYASSITLPLPLDTTAQRERAAHIVREVQKVTVPRVPRGLA